MQTPRYKIGDKVYRGFLTSDPPDCPTCHQPDYGDDSEDRWKPIVQESTVVGIDIKEGIRECSDGVSYQLDNEHWIVDEDSLHATHYEALREITEEKERRRADARESHKALEEHVRSKGPTD